MSDSCVRTPSSRRAAQERVVAGVVDEESGVEREPVAHDRVRVAAGALGAFEHLDVVRAGEKACSPEPGDAAPMTAIRS